MARATISHRTITIDGHDIGLDIDVLCVSERDRVAASMAWMATARPDMADPDNWRGFVSDIVSPHVAFTIAIAPPPEDEQRVWSQAILVAASAFIEVNHLEPLIRHHIGTDHRAVS